MSRIDVSARAPRTGPPCLPPQPPAGEAWLHEIKHDGFRVVARKDGKRVRLYSRPGNDDLPLWIAPGASPAIDIRVGVGQLPRRTARGIPARASVLI
jgi:hypothetical protein